MLGYEILVGIFFFFFFAKKKKIVGIFLLTVNTIINCKNLFFTL